MEDLCNRKNALSIPTDPFTILECKNPSHDVPELHTSPDLKALTFRKGRSGCPWIEMRRRLICVCPYMEANEAGYTTKVQCKSCLKTETINHSICSTVTGNSSMGGRIILPSKCWITCLWFFLVIVYIHMYT